jgi:hypothetical protein
MGYSNGDLILVGVQVINSIDTSIISDTLTEGAVFSSAPITAVSNLQVASTDLAQAVLSWDSMTLTNSGHSPILQYEIYVETAEDSTGSLQLMSTTLATSVTITGLSHGTTRFNIRARNVHGQSPEGTIESELLAGPPSKMTIPTTDTLDTNVIIEWDNPAHNGAEILGYQVYVKNTTTNDYEEITMCSVSSDPTTINTQKCTVPMSEFTTQWVATGQLIQIKIRAYNIKGVGEFSDPNTTGVISQAVSI